jgi:hypothetical protein
MPMTTPQVAQLIINTPSTVVAGQGFKVTITAADAYGNTVTGFNGPVTLTSNDGQTVLVSANPINLINGTATVTVTLNNPSDMDSLFADIGFMGQGSDIFNVVASSAAVPGGPTSLASMAATPGGPTSFTSSPALQKAADDGSEVAHGLASGNFGLAMTGLENFLALYASSSSDQQLQLLAVFFQDLMVTL